MPADRLGRLGHRRPRARNQSPGSRHGAPLSSVNVVPTSLPWDLRGRCKAGIKHDHGPRLKPGAVVFRHPLE